MSQQNALGGAAGAGMGMFPDLGKLVKAMTEKPVLDLAGDKSSAAGTLVFVYVLVCISRSKGGSGEGRG